MQQPKEPLPSLGRMMAFIDGENLVARFQAMRDSGLEIQDGLKYRQDVYVWNYGSIYSQLNVVLRATYYTYCFGDNETIHEAARELKSLEFSQYAPIGSVGGVRLLKNLYPKVFSKQKTRSGKGVDIQMTVDVLSNVYQNNLDTVYLVSGDGDYEPLISECQRQGKQVIVAALSSGLSPKLPLLADMFVDLDGQYFKTPPASDAAR